ncbi:hypothetical protein [Streptomyces sp. DH10]|uniref:hypothetical protein n=1 Tax=Streptomyces sp. DH10 TaxID=3040121 RepID=UPI0024418A1B|nr:hypothetical protein [Streptomyces sp. DH10]MDG9711997.1 hypothetical protein [Streptomyces sp. DH10]
MTGDQQVPEILGELAAAMADAPPTTDGYWTSEELHDLYERFEKEPDLPLTDCQRRLFMAQRARNAVSSRVHGLLRSLEKAVEHGRVTALPEVAVLAEACVRARLAAFDAISVLYRLGVPYGEQALARLVPDMHVGASARRWGRWWLRRLREPMYRGMASRPVEGEEPLLPELVRNLTVGWQSGWEIEEEPTQERFAQARAILEALLPSTRLPFPEPIPEWEGDWDEDEDERPDWLEIRMVLRDLMPDVGLVTRERMTEGWYECRQLGLDLQGEGPEEFGDRWATRIGAWTAEGTLSWLWREDQFSPWAQDLARRYIDRNVAVAEATRLLSEAAAAESGS